MERNSEAQAQIPTSPPASPREGDRYRTPGGVEYMWVNGSWHQMTARKITRS